MQRSVTEILPWLDATWRTFWGASSGLPHALLLAGPAGVGKRVLAEAIAARLLCERTGSSFATACGQCDSCRWLDAGYHPDFRKVIPEIDAEEPEAEEDASVKSSEKKKPSKQILVEQIRALADFVYVGGHRAGARVIVLQPAEAMNAAAANSLLKILEEPPATVYFILISDNHRRLLPTIRSRCRVLLLPRPDRPMAERWITAEGGEAGLLDITGGMPLLACELGERGWQSLVTGIEASLTDIDQDETTLAGRWETLLKDADILSMPELIGLVQKWVSDLAGQQIAGRARFFSATRAPAEKLLGRSSAISLLHCYNQLVTLRPLANHPLNPRLFLEDMAARYLAAFRRAPG